MSVLFILIGISLLIALGFLMAFLWASKSGQYEDDYSPSVRILFDDQPTKHNPDIPDKFQDRELIINNKYE